MAKSVGCAIVIPCFNPDLFELSRAINSVIATAKIAGYDVAVIVIDDCSTLVTPAQYGNLLGCIAESTYIRLEENSGPGAARNSGINHAVEKMNAKVVGFLDADDLMCQGWTQALELMDVDSTVSVVSCGFKKNGKKVGMLQVSSLHVWANSPFTRISSIFVRSSHLIDCPIRFRAERVGEDTEFIWRLLSSGGWRHLPIAASSYNYDFKDHLVYPHPLFLSCESDPDFRRTVENEGLFEVVGLLNERNGLLLRDVTPGCVVRHSKINAYFLFAVGALARKIVKFAQKVAHITLSRFNGVLHDFGNLFSIRC